MFSCLLIINDKNKVLYVALSVLHLQDVSACLYMACFFSIAITL